MLATSNMLILQNSCRQVWSDCYVKTKLSHYNKSEATKLRKHLVQTQYLDIIGVSNNIKGNRSSNMWSTFTTSMVPTQKHQLALTLNMEYHSIRVNNQTSLDN